MLFDPVGDKPTRKAVPGGEIGEAVAVEKRDSFDRADPEISSGILVHLGGPIPNRAVLSSKKTERGLLSAKRFDR